MADVMTLQRAAGNSAVTGLLNIQRTPTGGSGDGPPALTLPKSPEALGARLGLASKGLPSRFDYIVTGINKANLSPADAVKAATSATREIGLRLFSETVGDDVVLCSVQPGRGKPVLIVRPNGVVVRGTADIAVAHPPSLERPMVVTNVTPNVAPGETTGPAKLTPGEIGAAPPMGGTTEGPGVGKGFAVGGAAAEAAAMLEFALSFIALPLFLDWMESGVMAQNQENIKEAWVAAMPKVQAELGRHGVGEHPSGEFASILQQTKGGKIVYANISFEIEHPYLEWAGPGRMTPEEMGLPRVPGEQREELPYVRIKLTGVKLSTANINRDERGNYHVRSVPLYDPTAIATELLPKMPESV